MVASLLELAQDGDGDAFAQLPVAGERRCNGVEPATLVLLLTWKGASENGGSRERRPNPRHISE